MESTSLIKMDDLLPPELAVSVADVLESEGELVTDFDGMFANFAATAHEVDLSPWSYGQDEEEIHPESRWVIDINEFYHGFMGFEPGPDGRPVQGRRPDTAWSLWSQKYPTVDPEKSWLKKGYKFNAICLSSPIEEHIGVKIQFADSRAMSRGYANIERALRDRVKRAFALKQQGQDEDAAALASRLYPVVQLGFKMQVKTKMGRFNAVRVEQVAGEEGWVGVPQSAPAIPREPEPAATQDDDEHEQAFQDAEPAEAPPRRRRRRRS